MLMLSCQFLQNLVLYGTKILRQKSPLINVTESRLWVKDQLAIGKNYPPQLGWCLGVLTRDLNSHNYPTNMAVIALNCGGLGSLSQIFNTGQGMVENREDSGWQRDFNKFTRSAQTFVILIQDKNISMYAHPINA